MTEFIDKDVPELREEIDAIDSLVAHLLFERTRIARRVVALRQVSGGPAYDTDRILAVNNTYVSTLTEASGIQAVLDFVNALLYVCR